MRIIDYGSTAGNGHPGRTASGCWTCRVRRKKCDEKKPVCENCALLHITCHNDPDKPEWMDGAAKQAEMAEQVKREVKDKARFRRAERWIQTATESAPVHSASVEHELSPQASTNNATPIRLEPCPGAAALLQREPAPTLTTDLGLTPQAFGTPESVLFTFYLEHVFPFLFPFYRPSILQGGKAWILEMMIKAPVIRQALLCQSAYFFSLAGGCEDHDAIWDMVLKETRNAFEVLGGALQVLNASDIKEHVHGAARVLTSIMQVQRFEVTVLSSGNCRAHFDAAVALFKQLVESVEASGGGCPRTKFSTVVEQLTTPSASVMFGRVQITSAEQAAFKFSSALLIWDDIIASTVLQETPKLYGYHRSLLDNFQADEVAIDMEKIIGCQNWVLLQIGEVAVLEVWKQQCIKESNLNVMELVTRATAIKEVLKGRLAKLNAVTSTQWSIQPSVLEALTATGVPDSVQACQTTLITRVWAHGALLYLFSAVSGWQCANPEVRYHVGKIVELLKEQQSPALIRTMVWPFCVAGCLAEQDREDDFRGLVQDLQPTSVYGVTCRALQVMENVWKNRDNGDRGDLNLSKCLNSLGNPGLLV